MTTDAPNGRADPIDVIFRSLDESEWGRRNLPKLVALLTHDRARVRQGAGWAITYVAEEHPDTAEYLVRRLGDRLTDEEVPLALEQAFFGVATRYPDVVEEALSTVLESARERPFERTVGGSMLRAGSVGTRHRDVGRVRLPRGADPDDEQQVYTGNGEDDWWRLKREKADAGEGDDAGSAKDAGSERSEDAVDRPRGRPARELWAETNHLSVIAASCRFDDLAVTSERRRGRYADAYRMHATLDEEEFAASLLLFRDPRENVAAYVEDLEGAFGLWDHVDGVEGIRTIHDWGREPRPWVLVEYADKSLDQRGRFSTDEALWNARHLAASLSHAHENGVVHGGVDPGNVSYHENLLDPEERQIPMLTNVGVLSVVRKYFDPTARLDPRFAAPEYFDRRFGRIDHSSDVYGLGAICYLLFTGKPPYRGDYESVRDAVLSPTTPTPSAAADVPAGLDEIVGKAMATEKLHRYEGVTHLAADLRAVAKRDEIGRIYESYPRAVDTGGDETDDAAPDTSTDEPADDAAPDASVGEPGTDEPADDPATDGERMETPERDERTTGTDGIDDAGLADGGTTESEQADGSATGPPEDGA